MYPTKEISMVPTTSLLERFITESKLERRGVSLKELRRLPGRDTISLGIDGNKILDQITQQVREHEKMAALTYATPLTIYRCRHEIYTQFSDLSRGLAPFQNIFMFNGMLPFETMGKFEVQAIPSDVATLTGGTTKSSPKFISPETQARQASRFTIDDDVETSIIDFFRASAGSNTFRAPYLAWAQLSAFFCPTNQLISEVYGCLELLAYPGVDRVVTHVDVVRKTFNYVSKSDVLQELRKIAPDLMEEALDQLIMIQSRASIFRPVNIPTWLPSFADLVSESCRNPNIPPYKLLAENGDDMASNTSRNVASLNAPVMGGDASCVPLYSLYNKPSTVGMPTRRFFGIRLPSIFYYFFFAGPISPKPFSMVGTLQLVDQWPIVDSSQYRTAAERILPLRVQVAYQLEQFVRDARGEESQMEWIRHYLRDPLRRSEIYAPPDIHLDSWNIVNHPELREKEKTGRNVYFYDIVRFAHCAGGDRVRYATVTETRAAVLLKSLDLLGYFTHPMENEVASSDASVYCRALSKFTCDTLTEYAVILIELLRTDCLHDHPFVLVPTTPCPQMARGVRFLSRVLSIIPLNVSDIWTGPIDAEVAAFGSITRMLGKTLRTLTETVCALIFANGSTYVPLDQFDQVQAMLPFRLPVEFNGGVLIMYILLNPTQNLNDLQKAFPQYHYLVEDLEVLFQFWYMAQECIRTIMMEEGEQLKFDVSLLDIGGSMMEAAHRRLMGMPPH